MRSAKAVSSTVKNGAEVEAAIAGCPDTPTRGFRFARPRRTVAFGAARGAARMRRPGSERDGVWETVRHDVDRECSTYERYVCLRLKPRKTSKIELCPPARRRRTNAEDVAFRPICFRSDASVEPKATAGGVFAELEFREFRAHGGALAPVRALKGTGFPSRDLSGTRPGLAAGGGCLREHQLGLTRGKARGCSHRNRTRARVNARARGSLMVAYCVHPCRSRRRVGLDGPAPTDICGCRWSGIRR